MSKDSKKVLAVVVTALAGIGVATVLGGWLMEGRDYEPIPYKEAAGKTYPDPTIFPTVKGEETPGVDLAKMFTVNASVLARGKKLYGTYCTACHGADGKGDGPAAAAMKPAPRDFASAKGWTRGYTLADLYVSLTEGVKGTGMTSFDMLEPSDRFAVAHYVESLGAFDHHDRPAVEMKTLDARYRLSKGIHTPNKVAVPTVMKHEVAEYQAPPPVRIPSASDTAAGAELSRRLLADPARAARVLAGVPDWRTDLTAFAHAAMAGTPWNGFRPTVATLDRGQWELFHDEIVRRTPASGRSPTDRPAG